MLSRLRALEWDLRIEAEGDEILSAVEPVAVTPVSAAGGRNQEREAAAKGHSAGIANEGASGMLAVDEGVGAGN